jgi:valyl-tRNA synthetase
LRFTLAAMESQGRDIKLDEKRVEGYRNFATKLWNAARFLQMNGVGASQSIAAPEAELPVNRWIISEVVETLAKLDRAFDELRFDGMADAIYHFVWGTFCDWYVELVKPLLSPLPLAGGEGGGSLEGEDAHPPAPSREREGEQDETRRVAAWAFDQILVMLHPLMPFITEELWAAMGERPYELIVAKWPDPRAQVDPRAKIEIDSLVAVIAEARTMRAELNIPWSATLTPHVIGNASLVERLGRDGPTLARMAKLAAPVVADATPPNSAQVVVNGTTIAFPLGDAIDLDSERARLLRAAEGAEKERDSLAQRLANPAFTERAKPEAVEKARADHEAKSAEADRLRAALERLG